MRHLILLLFFTMGCNNSIGLKENNKSKDDLNIKTIWVDSTRGECPSTENHGCLKIKSNEDDPWSILNGSIDGFEFIAGNIYKLKVSLKKEQTTSDKMSYILIEQLESLRDAKLRLHDLWSLRKIDGEEINLISEKNRPLLEIYIAKMSLGGSSGCNNLQAEIIKVDDETISFDNIATTKMMCQDFRIEQSFLDHLRVTNLYKLGNLSLTLMDETGNGTLTFRKVD